MSRVFLKKNTSDGYKEVVTDKDVGVYFNFQYDRLENPTDYMSEYSYSLRLPRCPENNRFFDEFGRLDSVVLAGGYDPTIKMKYVVVDSAGMLLSTGDAIVSSITPKEFILSLVGSGASIFNKLLNAGWDTDKANEDEEYTLLTDWLKKEKLTLGTFPSEITRFRDGDNRITRDTVFASWKIDKPIFDLDTVFTTANLRRYYNILSDTNITETLAFIVSLIGFAPISQGRYNNFQSDTWYEMVNPLDYRFLPVYCSSVDAEGNPIKTVDVGDGTIDVQMGEYRSYYQQPFIYISALWQLIQKEFTKIIPGYRLELDARWYNESNSELSRLVYMLPTTKVDRIDKIESAQILGGSASGTLPSVSYSGNNPNHSINGLVDDWIRINTNASGAVLYETNEHTLHISVSYNGLPDGGANKYYFSPYNPFYLIVDEVGFEGGIYYIFPIPSDGTYTEESVKPIAEQILQNNRLTILYPIYEASATALSFSVDITERDVPIQQLAADIVEVDFYNENVPIVHNSQYYFTPGLSLTLSFSGTRTVTTNYRSFSELSLERLFRDVRPADVLMQYTKTRHLLWRVDDENKVVTVIRAQDYYSDCLQQPLTDMTDKVDYGKEISISPLSWDNHIITFNLGQLECDGVDGYEERYGVGYGNKKLITTNNLNRENKELLSNPPTTSITYSQSVVPSRVLQVAGSSPVLEAPPMPIALSDGESESVSGNMYYRHNNTSWDNELLRNWREDGDGVFVFITDDGSRQIWKDTYCWIGRSVPYDRKVVCHDMPVFNTVSDGGLSVLFAPVREAYTQNPDAATDYLYEKCWKNYVEEVYNAQNKLLSCYIYISRMLLERLRNNPFVIIEHVIYMLLSIEGWSEDEKLCRCTLRQISDINKLTI